MKNSSASPAKTLRVVLSPKDVHDFFIRNKSNREQDIHEKASESSADSSSQQNRKKNFRDSEIVDSDRKRPTILLDQISPDNVQKISMYGYMRCNDKSNGH